MRWVIIVASVWVALLLPLGTAMTSAPLLITIGPQCAGKTTYLRTIPDCIDISIDNQPHTYEQVEVSTVLQLIQTDRYV